MTWWARVRDWWARRWAIPDVGRTEAMHLQDVQLRAWTIRKFEELHGRIEALELKVEALGSECNGDPS